MGKIRRFIFRILIASGFLAPVVRYCLYNIEEVVPNSASGPVRRPAGRQRTILALNPDRFRGDLEILASSPEFRVFRAPFGFQKQLAGYYYPPDVYAHVAHQTDVGRVARDRFRKFLKPFLLQLYAAMPIDCVIGAGHYHQDIDWGSVSNDLKVPYVVFYRENLIASPAHRRRVVNNGQLMGRFGGAHVFVHAETVRELWVASNFIASDKITALGALRMDEFVRRIRAARPAVRDRKRVTFFSFAPGTGLAPMNIHVWPEDASDGLVRFFRKVHVAFAELAIECPDVDFVIKPKWGHRWITKIGCTLSQAGLPSDIPNLKIDASLNVHDLIFESDIVIAYGSTTLIEAAVAGKPVILPFFEEAAEDKFADCVLLRDEFHNFEVVGSPRHLKDIVRRILADGYVPRPEEARWKLFERHVSFADGSAKEKYVEALTNIIQVYGRQR